MKHFSGLTKRRKIKNLFKDVRKLVSEKKYSEAKKILPLVYKNLDKTAKKGIIKKNAASRKKSRITKLINKIKT